MTVQTAVSGTVMLADVSPDVVSTSFGMSPLVWLVTAIVLLLGGAGWWVARKRLALPAADTKPALGAETSALPPPVERLTVDKPVEINESMSLREVKQAKAARMSGAVDATELIRLERERRRTTVTAAAIGSLNDDGSRAGVPSDAAESAEPGSSLSSSPAAASDSGAASTAGAAASASSSAPSRDAALPAAAAGRTLQDGLARTRGGFMARLGSLFAAKQVVDDATMEAMEEVLFTADIGMKTSERILQAVHRQMATLAEPTTDAVWAILRNEMSTIVRAHAAPLKIDRSRKPTVIMMVGVNGAGKTTTIGKLAARYRAQGLKVMMVAGDTFRAAAVDQLVEWARRVDAEVHQGEANTDPSGVVFEGLRRAVELECDVVLVDTAGRLQTKKPLMDELQKITRVANKAIPGAPHETVLVLDANTGQNGIQQARLFGEAAPLTGIVLTKLDGSAKGGVVIGVSDEMKVPIYFVGIGEAPEDLRAFDANEFVDALF